MVLSSFLSASPREVVNAVFAWFVYFAVEEKRLPRFSRNDTVGICVNRAMILRLRSGRCLAIRRDLSRLVFVRIDYFTFFGFILLTVGRSVW
jgi:hypothetical protein